MPKLLQINITANWGSTGKIAESIGIAAMYSGWESYIAFDGENYIRIAVRDHNDNTKLLQNLKSF